MTPMQKNYSYFYINVFIKDKGTIETHSIDKPNCSEGECGIFRYLEFA